MNVTSCPAAANSCASRCQIFSVDPPITGGTGRKNPVTIVMRIGSAVFPRKARQRGEQAGRGLFVRVTGDAGGDRGSHPLPGCGITQYVECVRESFASPVT